MTSSEPEPGGLTWRKARRSNTNGMCVEVASAGKMIAVRDSKNPEGPILLYPSAVFGTFLGGAKNGEFDPS